MSELLAGWKRTHFCGQIGLEDCGKEAVMMGWVQVRRDLGAVIFVDLRDKTGLGQVVFDKSLCRHFDKAEQIRSEYVIAVQGVIRPRSPETVNPNMVTGQVELKATDIKVLSASETPPFEIDDDTAVNETLRLKYRYLDLRRPSMQSNLFLRSKVCSIVRNFLAENGFTEIETPILCKSTPEGARDYLVPSRVHEGEFYALPQSPQLFKQILMVSGMDRYYQIARCFRDEDLRADRQPEFTQIDMELSFVEENDVMEVNERLMARIFKECLGYEMSLPLKRITWQEAMDKYGSDKPDLRFGLEMVDVSDLVKDTEFKAFAGAVAAGGSVRAINAKGCVNILARREIDALGEFVKTFKAKGLAWISLKEEGIQSAITKFFTPEQTDAIIKRLDGQTGDILFFIADSKNEIVYKALGELRLRLGKRLDLIDKNDFKFCWVTEFPLLEYSEEEQRLVAVHHPFTSPMDEDLSLLDTDPLRARAKAYDMVLNGVELGGGSIRIHVADVQEKMFQLIGLDEQTAHERFGYLLNAFRYGVPPHGGLAFGLDRLVMLLAGKDSIRDVIAFPKVQNASCLMTDAPTPVDDKQLRELHIRVDKRHD
ncbi:MAG: aspartate--tRNA ligase [Eubacteriales bacterium]|nr:aspartate--tRNA ligase [Eubacteriales bacterium]